MNKIQHIGQSGLTSSGGKWTSQMRKREFYIAKDEMFYDYKHTKNSTVTYWYFLKYYDKRYQNINTFIRIEYD